MVERMRTRLRLTHGARKRKSRAGSQLVVCFNVWFNVGPGECRAVQRRWRTMGHGHGGIAE